MLSEKSKLCVGCPAYDWGIGFVPFTGPPTSKIAFVGQGPGESEAYSGVPFHPNAPSGSRLTRWIHLSHFQRCDVVIGNIVQCWLPKVKVKGSGRGNRDPAFKEAQWCWNAHVGPYLYDLNERFVPTLAQPYFWNIPVGIPAAKFLLGIPWGKGGEKYVGTVQLCELPEIGVNK